MSEINKTKIKILEIIISSVIGLLFSFAFCIITQPSFLIFIMFCCLGIMIPGFISVRSPKIKYENKYIITVINKSYNWGWPGIWMDIVFMNYAAEYKVFFFKFISSVTEYPMEYC